MNTHTPAAVRNRRRSLILTPALLLGFILLTFSGPTFNSADFLGFTLIAGVALAIAHEAQKR